MLIRSYDQTLQASSRRQSTFNMAPSTVVFDYRGQIVDNCEFFLAKHDVVSVVTVKDVLGDYKAYAIRSNQSSRDALLSSEPRATPLLAVESLHTKSCEAVQQFITTNGFSFPPDSKKTRFDDEDEDEDEDEEDGNDDDDIASIFSNILSDRPALSTAAPSYKASSDREVKMTPATSAPTVPVTFYGREIRDERSNNNISKPRTNPPPPPPGRQSPEAFIFPNIRPPYTLSQAEELVMELMNGPLSNNYPRFPGPPPPPPPPPGYNNTAPKPQAAIPSWPPAAARGPSIPPANFSPPGASRGSLPRGQGQPSAFPPQPRLYDIALTIRWLGHGEARVLASCKASVTALKSTAVTYVTRHAGAFDKEGQPPNRNNPKWMGCVRLRRASIRNVNDEEYDLNMELYQDDDLTRFCAGRGIPRFEVEVEDQDRVVDGGV
ncbi:hypothetical protein F5Y00DRAFT_108985 [Daldinia vernicosa]|uniref:uncharacterized protein n=1 Tax=Daldinia vernicosa TaxID=114800 RepID=UPI002007A227|nr:uncharacterized protein F5Y00DRAFT_108985 [Daldinia vernicosa]KAI0847724.1 hypothetical protein F5Y00DRAFT_108985 [Daldinia vernicosa]